MLDPTSFAREILLEAEDSELTLALLREREAMWPLLGDIESINMTGGGGDIVQLSVAAFNIKLVAFNGLILTHVVEPVLDALNTDWRNAVAGSPQNYLYLGELPTQQLRLYPAPATDGLVQVITQPASQAGVALWHDIYLALSVISRLAISDPLRSRPQLAELLQPLKELIIGSFGLADFRSERR